MDQLRSLIVEIIREELPRLTAEAAKGSEYMSTTEAARHARVSTGTVRRWIREGCLNAFGAGRAIRVRREELESLMKAGRAARGKATPPSRSASPELLAARAMERLGVRSGQHRGARDTGA